MEPGDEKAVRTVMRRSQQLARTSVAAWDKDIPFGFEAIRSREKSGRLPRSFFFEQRAYRIDQRSTGFHEAGCNIEQA